MGIVYKARDTRLGRLVALKVPRAEALADSVTRTRFQTEARAAAGLDHPNLVPIYEAGEAGSVCFIASAYCPGITLAAWLKRHTEPVPAAAAAALVATLADAVHHAHIRGILHRDLKPANVMLSPLHPSESSTAPADLASAVPKILDFGLAKQLSAAADRSSGVGPTVTGQILGTPCYMAPEQAGSKADIGPPTDVYALGAILYEFLTLRPPFAGGSILEILEQVRSIEPVPPCRLRFRVPRDLETICMKCLRKEPGRRYASARDLADDLRRFQDGTPIRARPVGTGERLIAWCRRSPRVAALLAALVFVFAAGSLGVLWQWRLAEHNAAEAARNADDYLRERNLARQEKARAEHHLKMVRDRVEQLDKLGRELLRKPGQYRAGKAVLEEALAFYKDLLPEEGSDPNVRREAAALFSLVGRIHWTLAQHAEATEAFGRHARLLTSLLEDDPSDRALRIQLSDSHRWRGNTLREQNKVSEARKAYDEAIKIHETLMRDYPDEALHQRALGNTLANLASMLSHREHKEEMARLFERILELDRAAVRAEPDNAHANAELAIALGDQAAFFLNTGRLTEAETAIREALEIHEKMLERGQLTGGEERYAARSYERLGRILAAAGQAGKAEDAFRKAIDLLEPLVEKLPEAAVRRSALVESLLGLVNLLKNAGRREDAEKVRSRLVHHLDALAADFPDDPQYRRGAVLNRLQQITVLCELGRQADATEPYLKALAVDSEDPVINNERAWFLVTSPWPSFRDAAVAVRLAKKAVTAEPKAGGYHNTLGVAYYRNGDDKAAIGQLEISMSLRGGGDSLDWFCLAMAHQRLGDRGQARQWFDRAVQWMDKHRPNDDELRRFRAEAEAALGIARKSA
jgi:tetratricopeptide (TPR) repeat protein